MYRFMIGNDFHFPAQDNKAVDLWFQVMRYWKPDEIDLLGDISDGTEYSKHVTGGTTEFFNKHDIPKEDKVYNLDAVIEQVMENERPAREFIAENRRVRKKANIHVWDGNHEWPRIYDYFDKYYPEALSYINPHTIYGLDKVKAEYHWYSDEPTQRHGDLYLHHGNMVGTNAGDSVKKHLDAFGVSMVIGHCFDDQTEILTAEGWKMYSELSEQSVVMTANRDTKALEWNQVQEVMIYDHYKELIHVEGQGLDLMVTPGHGLVAESVSGKWNYPTAEERFGKTTFFPLAGHHDEESLPLSDDEIRFLILFMADGCHESGKYIRISQSDDGKGDYEECIRLLESLNYDYSKTLRYKGGTVGHGVYRHYDAYRFYVKSEVARQLVLDYLEPNTKNPTRKFAKMSHRQMNIALDMYALTDGCINSAAKNSRQLMSYDKEKRDFIQELAVRTGHRSSVQPKHVTINSRSSIRIDPDRWTKVPYDGIVWCVSVPNGTLVVRRKGKTVITQNCHRIAHINKTFNLRGEILRGYENGHMCDKNSPLMGYTNSKNWQQGFMIGLVDDNGKAHVNQIHITDDYTCMVNGRIFYAGTD